jgi:DNA repair ATPase RecN
MLIGLTIRDVVLIESLDLAIGPGLTALTGETAERGRHAKKNLLLKPIASILTKKRTTAA